MIGESVFFFVFDIYGNFIGKHRVIHVTVNIDCAAIHQNRSE